MARLKGTNRIATKGTRSRRVFNTKAAVPIFPKITEPKFQVGDWVYWSYEVPSYSDIGQIVDNKEWKDDWYEVRWNKWAGDEEFALQGQTGAFLTKIHNVELHRLIYG